MKSLCLLGLIKIVDNTIIISDKTWWISKTEQVQTTIWNKIEKVRQKKDEEDDKEGKQWQPGLKWKCKRKISIYIINTNVLALRKWQWRVCDLWDV